MGVYHGEGIRGDKFPEFKVVQIVPLRFLSYRYKKERSVAFKIRKSIFGRGSARTPMGGSRRSPNPIVGWRGATPPIPHHT